jgi:hypothetical protein
MGADVSRNRFDALRDFAGVVLQQGRLLLDADFNEYVAMVDRRLRAETVDLTSSAPMSGGSGAWVPLQTPDGFRVTLSGGALTIGRGRMYVDGLLAENHGLPPLGFDAVLGEPAGTADTPHDKQPYLPVPPQLPSGGPYLVYLDVWRREVTRLEAPDLVEVAVGVDTTARWQTTWQVRLLVNAEGGAITCATPDDQIPGWLDVIQPSAGRLTTGTIPIDPADDPCALPPTGGYSGLENQTYRVEVHAGGPPGTATFKWSRDNGSVAIPVVEMVTATVLRLASVGRDDVLRVSTGDWVEIIDDHYELGQRPGELRKVTVDDAERTITFEGDLPAELQPSDAADTATRHLRVRRWDQSGVVKDAGGNTIVGLDAPGAAGVIPVSPGTQVVLENGVVVTFSLAPGGSGRFRPGDHWIFAARVANTWLEPLDAAPPLGVHHHYARLGIVTFPDAVTDCRQLWPLAGGDGQGCDCTVCVSPQSHASGALTVQGAVDRIRSTGGTICLAPGVYELDVAVDASLARSVRMRGQGPATILVTDGTAVTATQPLGLTIEDLAIVSANGTAPAVQLVGAVETTVQDVAVLSYGTQVPGGPAIALSGACALVAIRRCVLVGTTGVDAGAGARLGVLAAGLRVEDNVILGSAGGIDLGGQSAYLSSCLVARNQVQAGAAGGIVATGVILPGGALTVTGNTVTTSGTGIVAGPGAAVESNVVGGQAPSTTVTAAAVAQAGSDGIVIAEGGFAAAPGQVRVAANRVSDRSGTGIALRAPVLTWHVDDNIIERAGTGIAIEGGGSAERVVVEGNEVLGAATGILLAGGTSLAIAHNRVVGPTGGVLRAGILALGSVDVRVSDNVIDRAGPLNGFLDRAIGICVAGPFDIASVSGNSSRYGAGGAVPAQGAWYPLLIQSAGSELVSFGGAAAAVSGGQGATILTKGFAVAAAPQRDSVNLSSNVLAGGPDIPTCLVRVGGDLIAQGNYCQHQERSDATDGLVLQASVITASTNRLRGGRSRILLQAADDGHLAAVGNLAPGGTRTPGGGLPGPWAQLNPTVP